MEEKRSAGIAFRVLGPVEALRGEEILPLGGPRQRALLATLLLEPGHVVSTDVLIDELWAGEPTEGAEVSLRSYISRARAALGDATPITARDGGYAIAVERDAIDARVFERRLREAQEALRRRNPARARALASEAVSLWRGPAYGELAGTGLLRAEAERLEELRADAAQLRIEASLAIGEAGGLVDELEALVRANPYRERLWQFLMLALYRADRQADALTAYQRARDVLVGQLGLDPGAGLELLQQQILRHEVPIATPIDARHNLPASLSTFIGRTKEVAEVSAYVEQARLVTLIGVGGAGKTRLALEVARARLADHPDGVFFVDLAPIADPERLTGHLAATLDIREQPGVSGVDRLTSHLRESDVLLVLDNCEHLRAACAELATRLLRACPRLRLLATSREVLGVPGEVGYAVGPLALPAGAAAGPAPRGSDAVRLFLERAREVRPGFPDDDKTIETIARICAELDGLPLAIELAAARAKALSPAEIGARLHDRFQFLVSWRRLAPARHRTLREAMDWSYDLLAEGEQRLLRSLSVFAGGFTLQAVAAVSADGDEDAALTLVERLVEASLVSLDTGLEPTRYRILETVRQYGAEQVAHAGETDALRQRHADHFTTVAFEVWLPLRTAGLQSDWFRFVEQDRENLRAALTWHHARGDVHGMLRLCEAMWRFWWIRGELREGRSWLETSLAAAGPGDPAVRASVHLGLAGLAWAAADLDAAEENADVARTMFDELGNNLEAGAALNTLGLIAFGRRDTDGARRLFAEALDRYRSPGVDPEAAARFIAVAVDNLGSADHDLGDDASALGHFREALAIHVASGDAEGIAMNELHMGTIEAERGNLAQAGRLIASALRVYRDLGFGHYAAECLEAAAIVANATSSHEEAAVLLGAASRIRDDVGFAPLPYVERLREREIATVVAAIGTARYDGAVMTARTWSAEASMDRAIAWLEALRA